MTDPLIEAQAARLFEELSSLIVQLYPDQTDWFLPGISDDEIERNEKLLGASLPPHHRAALHYFNGFRDTFGGLDIFPPATERAGFEVFRSMGEWRDEEDFYRGMLEEWRPDFEAGRYVSSGPVRGEPWGAGRILIGFGPQETFWFLDFAPEPGGTSGQIVMLYIDSEEHEICVVAPDFLSFMQVMIDSLKRTIAEA